MLFQGLYWSDARRAKSRGDAEEDRRRDHRRGGERQHPPIERQVEDDPRHGGGQLRDERPARPGCEHESKGRATCRQHNALHEELAREPPARGPQREPHAQFMLAGHASGQLQVGDVPARDEQHERDDDEDRDERPLEPLA